MVEFLGEMFPFAMTPLEADTLAAMTCDPVVLTSGSDGEGVTVMISFGWFDPEGFAALPF